MTCNSTRLGLPFVYILIIAAAVIVDLGTDRSGGALILAALPISVVAFVVAIVGQWRMKGLRTPEFANWLAGSVLILALAEYFASGGSEAASVGADVFTYAMLALAPPSSFVAASAWVATEVLPAHGIGMDIFLVWLATLICGTVQWVLVVAAFKKIRRQN